MNQNQHRPHRMLPRTIRMIMLFGALLFALSAQAAKRIDAMVVFGDSLSDPGNAFSLLGEQTLPPYNLIPDAPYAVGGHHFSNGATWVEQLGHVVGVPVGPAFSPAQGFTNYAIGGARARSFGQIYLSMQVATYLGRNGGKANSSNLYVLFIGGNDVRDAIESYALDPKGELAAAILTDALAALSDNLYALISAGASDFLILNAPDLGLVPALSQNKQARMLASQLSTQFNQGLLQILATLKTNPAVEVKALDIFALLNQVVTQPADYKLSNVSDTCINLAVIEQPMCAKPETYLFWDGIHPTRKGHDLIAEAAALSLGLKQKQASTTPTAQYAQQRE